jgi:uncharacterized protein
LIATSFRQFLPVFALLLLFAGPLSAARTDTLVLETSSGEHAFTVEVAETEQERSLGLMFRRDLPADHGMIFLHEPPQPVFMWMRNTYIPLDMIFIDQQGRVHKIESHTEPFSTEPIGSDGIVAAVLELNAGTADRIGLRTGDRVIFPGLGSDQR